MKKIIYLLAGAVAAQCLMLPAVIAAEESEKEVLYWVAPMDPNYRRDEPGQSPMGMDLVPVYAEDAGDGDTITISPEVVQNLGVRTTEAEMSRLWRGIDTVGYVDFDESKLSHIHLRTEGWIENLAVLSEG
jgi:Cu(I)/Ag(I) efflux system membrane fusion protein